MPLDSIGSEQEAAPRVMEHNNWVGVVPGDYPLVLIPWPRALR